MSAEEAPRPFTLQAFLYDYNGPRFLGKYVQEDVCFIMMPEDGYRPRLIGKDGDPLLIYSSHGYLPCDQSKTSFFSREKFDEWALDQSYRGWPEFSPKS